MKNEYLLGQEKVGKALIKLSLPASIGFLVITIYNVVDTIFVGQLVGALAIGGVTVVLPISLLISTIGMSLGVGGASIISRRLGENSIEEARKVLGTLMVLVLIVGFFVLSFGYSMEKPILALFGAKEGIESYAITYYRIILAGAPFLSFAMMANNVVRSEGYAKVAMYSMLLSALLNTFLDAIFMMGFDMGLKGAAYATFISQVAIAVYLFFYFKRKDTVLSLAHSYWNLKWPIVKEIVGIGSSSFFRQGSTSIISGLVNNSLIFYGGVSYVAIYGIIFRLLMFAYFPMIGIIMGFLPLAGFNFGAGNYKRLQKTFSLSVSVVTLISIFCFVFIQLYSTELFTLFTNDALLIKDGSPFLRIICLTLPLVGFQMLGASYFQAVGKPLPALLLTLSRQFILLIPLIIQLPTYFGLNGVFYSFPIADVLSFIITLFAFLPYWRRLKKQPSSM